MPKVAAEKLETICRGLLLGAGAGVVASPLLRMATATARPLRQADPRPVPPERTAEAPASGASSRAASPSAGAP